MAGRVNCVRCVRQGVLKRTAEVAAAAADKRCRVAGRTNTHILARPNIISQTRTENIEYVHFQERDVL